MTTIAFFLRGPGRVCEGSNVTIVCRIIYRPGNIVQSNVWSRNGMPVRLSNGSFIPNHNQTFNYTIGEFTDLVITDVRLEDNSTWYSCTADGLPHIGTTGLFVTGKRYVHM